MPSRTAAHGWTQGGPSLRLPLAPRPRRRRTLAASLAVIVAIGAVLALAPWHARETTGAGAAARAKATVIAAAVLPAELPATDLRAPVDPVRRRVLDRLFRRQVLSAGIAGASLIGLDGTITYSTDHAMIGRVTSAAPGLPHSVTAAAPIILDPPARAGTLELTEHRAAAPAASPIPFVLLGALTGLALLILLAPAPPRPQRASSRQAEMQDMERRAYHDTLTGLPNRELFHRRVAEAIAGVSPEGGTVAVMLMDLDRFKEINDTFGHQSGDQLLSEVASHLSEAVRDQDTVARLGGDEFAIVCAPVAGPLGAVALAERAIEEVQRSHTVAGVEVDVDASIGIALYPRHGETADELLRCADIAMYASKERGGPTLFAPELDHHSVARLTLASQLRRAIAQRELAVYYQPKADIETGQITSAEALVRWEHPDLGLLPPDEFIPMAEQTGLIRPLTTYVLDAALEQSRQWRREGLNISVAVNITGRDLLDQRFAEEVKDLLRKWEVMPTHLELEITENTVLTDPVRARTVLMTLSQLGVRLAIDDFGSGNSSLSYLKRLPIDVLKIDKSFVLQMHDNEDDDVIVRSTIDLGHNLGLKVVAEGVSSITDWNRLRNLGCDVAQGYYLSRPIPGSEIVDLAAAAKPVPRPPVAAEAPAEREPIDRPRAWSSGPLETSPTV